MSRTTTDTEALLRRCYAAFNARDLEGALAVMEAIDPSVEPRAFTWEPDGRIAVSVHQVVRDLAGTVLADQMVEHVYQLQDGDIRRMEIRK